MEPTENLSRYQPRTAWMAKDDPVVQWLLQGDPAIRWQVLRDLTNASETEVNTERARVEHEGWGARLLALRAPDGLWANGACFPDTAAFAADTARALAAGEPPPPFPSPDEEPTDGPDAEQGQPWTATYRVLDRKSTRLNSSHVEISYAVFCLKKKKKKTYVITLKKKTHNK